MKKLDVTTRDYKSGFRAKVIRRPLFVQKFMGIIVDFGGLDEIIDELRESILFPLTL